MQKLAIPPKEELVKLLFDDLLPKKTVCRHYGVCLPVLSRWMRYYSLTGKISQELQIAKRKNTLKNKVVHKTLIERALEGEKIIQPGFNSEFVEEYMLAEGENDKEIQDN